MMMNSNNSANEQHDLQDLGVDQSLSFEEPAYFKREQYQINDSIKNLDLDKDVVESNLPFTDSDISDNERLNQIDMLSEPKIEQPVPQEPTTPVDASVEQPVPQEPTETENEQIQDIDSEKVIVNGVEFLKKKIASNQDELLQSTLGLLKEKHSHFDQFQTPTHFVNPSSQTLPMNDLDSNSIGSEGGKAGVVKNYSLFPSLGNMFKNNAETALQQLNSPTASNLNPNDALNNKFKGFTDSINNQEESLINAVSNQLACEKFNAVLDSHQSYNSAIEKFWKHDNMHDFQGELIEYAKSANKDFNSVIEDMNNGNNEPLRKAFQEHITNMESSESGKSTISSLHDSHRNFINKTNTAVDVLQNAKLSENVKEKLQKDVDQVLENQEAISSQIPSYINNDGHKIDLAEEMRKYVDSIKLALKAVVDFVKSKVGLSSNNQPENNSPAP